MSTFARNPKPVQQTTSPKSTMLHRTHSGQNPELSSILQLQRTIGNQAVQMLLHAETDRVDQDFPHDSAEMGAKASPTQTAVSRMPFHGAVQRNQVGNADLFTYESKGGQAKIAVADVRRILTWKKEITALLQDVSGQSYDHDMRFLLVLAMKFTEQAGRQAVAEPEGNNPFNIMGQGPAGSFTREKNKEYENGKHVTRPAKFAKYESEIQGTRAFLDILKTKWGPAYTTIMQGGSIEEFAKGLRPKKGGHYLTKPLQMHIKHLKLRLRRLLVDLEIVFTQAIAEADEEIASLTPLWEFSVSHATEGSLDDQRQRLSNAKNLRNRIDKLNSYKEELKSEMKALQPIRARIDAAQAIQDPAAKQEPATTVPE